MAATEYRAVTIAPKMNMIGVIFSGRFMKPAATAIRPATVANRVRPMRTARGLSFSAGTTTPIATVRTTPVNAVAIGVHTWDEP